MDTAPKPARADRALRALTDEHAFRVITVDTTETVKNAILAQKVTGPAADLFAELVTGAVLVRETMAPDLRLQAILQSGEAQTWEWRLIADAQPEGMTRGLVQLRDPDGLDKLALSPNSRLQIARTLHNGALHQGVVEAPADGGISGALMNYMQSSEQVVSTIAVGVHRDAAGEIVAAGGYLVQILPELAEGPLAVMTERLRHFDSIQKLLASGDAEPSKLMSELLYGMPYAEVGDAKVFFGCNCSRERILATLSTLPRADLQELLSNGKPVEMSCDYCNTQYVVEPAVLRGLIDPN
ncbi:MAG TPA: Hsp33 family molecular chaperone HslO [Polyangiaceae bacterium]